MVVKGTYKGGEKIRILFGKTKCKFLTSYPPKLQDIFSVFYPNYFFMPRYRSGNWDGKYHFITSAGYFSVGLLPVIFATLKRGEYPGETNRKNLPTFKPVEEVTLTIKESDRLLYHPRVLTYYLDPFDIISTLNLAQDNNTGRFEKDTFSISTRLIKEWKSVKDNPFQSQVKNLLSALRG